MPPLDALKNKGFTLLETLVIVLILGIGLAIATPSFLSSLEKYRLEQAVVEVRSAFRESQRQAIRHGDACPVVMDIANSLLTAPCINIGDRALPENVKLATNLIQIPQETESNSHLFPPNNHQLVASTNLNDLNLSFDYQASKTVRIGYCTVTFSGFKVYWNCTRTRTTETNFDNSNAATNPKLVAVNFGILGTAEFQIIKPDEPTSTPIDPTAKIVFYASANASKRCIAISNTLGLTRAGLYRGSTDPEAITTEGICTATE